MLQTDRPTNRQTDIVAYRDKDREKEYRFKYIGETNRSGYERGKEHWDMRRNFSEKSHLLKHCLLHHKEKNPEEVRFGMKLRRQYRSALERQVGEATAILEEKEKGIHLMNSKSEFNRCVLPRITTEDSKELLEKLKEEDEAEKEIKSKIRLMKKRKKRRKEEERKRKETLGEVCEDILEENEVKWKRRRLEEEVIKKMEERELEKKIKYGKEKRERIEKAKKKKGELLEQLEKKKEIVIVKEGKSVEWVKKKQASWRRYRERKRIDSEEEEELLMRIIEKIPEREIKMIEGSKFYQNCLQNWSITTKMLLF